MLGHLRSSLGTLIRFGNWGPPQSQQELWHLREEGPSWCGKWLRATVGLSLLICRMETMLPAHEALSCSRSSPGLHHDQEGTAGPAGLTRHGRQCLVSVPLLWDTLENVSWDPGFPGWWHRVQ